MAVPSLHADQRRFVSHLAVWFPLVGAVVCVLWILAADGPSGVVIGVVLAVAVLAIEARLLVVLRASRAARPTPEVTP